MPLKELTDIENVKNEVKNGNIVILRVTPLANKSIEEVKTAVNQLYEFTESVGGDIARLGEERVVICPKNIRIWREKTSSPRQFLMRRCLQQPKCLQYCWNNRVYAYFVIHVVGEVHGFLFFSVDDKDPLWLRRKMSQIINQLPPVGVT